MKTIVIASNKGGQGKTTSTINIGAGLHQMGNRVLLVDTDPQSNLTLAMGFDKNNTNHIANLILGKTKIGDIICHKDGIDLIPSSNQVSGYETHIASTLNYQFLLKEILDEVDTKYDYCIIDTPPHMGALTMSALVASKYLFIPCEPEYFAYEGLNTLITISQSIKKYQNQTLDLGGVFFTRYSASYRKRLHHDMFEAAKELLGEEKVMQTTIRDNVAIGEAHALQTNIFTYAPESNGAKDYKKLISEILKRISNGKTKL
jgi:chromosome partitioning protein